MKSSKFTSTPLFPRQALVALLLPLIAEQALSVTIGLADTLMVSSVGEAAVSGVSLVDSFNTLMIQIMSALATGGAVVTSQYIGHQEPKNAKAAAAQILFVLSSFSVLVAAVVIGGRHAILRGIFGSIDADVMHYAETYFLLSALSYPFIGLYNAGAALFRAQGNSKISMLSSLVMNVVNIGGNAVLIYGFGMGVMGAALASLVSRAIACAVVLYLLQKPDCALRVDSLRAMAPNGGLIRRILRVGIPAGIENGMFQIGKLSVSSLTSTLGTAAIAANAVANTTTTFLNIPANAVGMAALTVVGQCLGAGEKEQAVYYSRRLMLTAYCGAWVMNLSAFFFANRFAVSLFNASVVTTRMDGYRETGAGNAGLSVDKQEWTTGTLALGGRWMGLVGSNLFGREALAELRVNAAQDLGDDRGETAVGFLANPGYTQQVRGAKVGRTALQIGAGLSVPVGTQGTIFVNGNADIRDGASSLNGSIGYRYDF